MDDTADVEPQICNIQVTEEVKSSIDPDDAYGYTKTSNFTSEVFKIEVGNLPRHCGYGELKKLMNKKLKLNPHKINVVSRINKAYVTFKNEEDKIDAVAKLNAFVLKGNKLSVKNAKPKADVMAKNKRENVDSSTSEVENKKIKVEDENISMEDQLKNTVIPWWKSSYEEQLKLKQSSMFSSLLEIRKKVSAVDNLDNEVFVWLMQQKKESGAFCPMDDILPSPCVGGYRNKCGFTVGKNSEDQAMVGFRLGRYRDQVCNVENPSCLIHVPDVMKQIVECFTQYVQQSKLSVYNTHTHEGFWKQITVRTTLENSSMVIITMCKQNLTDEEIQTEVRSVIDHFETSNVKVDTMLYQGVPTHRCNSKEISIKTLTGEGVIYEKLFDLKFRISPDAFFQCNTKAAEVLYKCIGDLVKQAIDETPDSKETALLDVCCGTGTIGLTLSSCVNRLVGVDICEQAIIDAVKNATLNNITNAEFYVGKAEDVLPKAIEGLSGINSLNLVAVVDPPRCGLHAKVIKVIRQCPAIQYLIYVSCSVDQAKTNFVDLCRPQSKRLNGPPFKPMLAQPVDLFPHTKHCEVVLLFKRIIPVV
ncbi:tRNA (uracil-5-)-methyltransferase homolog A isoform X1 [Ciona intestinalis]